MPPKLTALSAGAAAPVTQLPASQTAATPHSARGRAVRRARDATELDSSRVPGVDSRDVGCLAAEAFKAAQAADAAAAAALGPDTPPWAAALVARMGALGEQMRADSAQVNAGLAQTNAAVVQMGARMRANFAQLHARFDHFDARMANRLASLNDPLMPLRAPGGDVPPDFPASRGDLHCLTGPQLAALLSAYGLAVPPEVEARRRAFASFIGVPA